MFDIGGPELILILVAVLLLFGPKKLPELAQGLGKGLREFRRAQREFTSQINNAFEEEQRSRSRSERRTEIERNGNSIAAPQHTVPKSVSGHGPAEASGEESTGETTAADTPSPPPMETPTGTDIPAPGPDNKNRDTTVPGEDSESTRQPNAKNDENSR